MQNNERLLSQTYTPILLLVLLDIWHSLVSYWVTFVSPSQKLRILRPKFHLFCLLELPSMVQTRRSILLFHRTTFIIPSVFILVDIDDSLVRYWLLFGAPAQKRRIYSAKFRLFCFLELHKMMKTSQSMLLFRRIKLIYP